jgi:NAD(P)-dependent dehydrogenase (short-subunit alcohol dehydrogenase family)
MGLLETRANLVGKVAVVVGGAAGIGAAVSDALAGAGVDVAFCDRNEVATEETRVRLTALGRTVLAQVADATDSAALARFYATVERRFPRLDIVVNVVGGVLKQPFMEATAAQCAADIHRNYGYLLDSFRLAIPLIRRGGRGGSIINFTTIEAHRGAAGFAVYAGAKAATLNFSRAMAVELGPEGIRVNTLAPDTTPSEGNFMALPPETRASMAASPEEWMALAMKMYIPLGQPPATEDLANGVLFLASDLSRCVSGTTLHVDGGTYAASGFVNWPEGEGFLPVPLAKVQRRLFGVGSDAS